ncbi:MAG TPA: zinc-binding alcohol dehydrogenase family protein [Puia sp.]|nr:zinc-binding alcohol dehydrogenase family protein [Puia sp.]
MKALICTKPGSFEYHEIDAPVMRAGHAIIKIKRIGICGTDLHAYEGTQPYFNYPRILGHELAADLVDADGADGFVPGESLTFIPYFSCGKCVACRNGKTNCCAQLKVSGVHIDGGMVEYLSVPSDSLIKSRGLSYEELALIEPFTIGAHGIRRAQVLQNEFVLVTGAGPIGLATIEFARIAGAHVIALDVNDARLEFCKTHINVPFTINASKEDVVSRLKEITNGDMPTVVIDATGNRKAINNAFQYMAHGGRYVLIGLQREEIIVNHPEFHKREATLMSSRNGTKADFEFVISNMSRGLINPAAYITHRVKFGEVKDEFPKWLNPSSGLIKAMVEMD